MTSEMFLDPAAQAWMAKVSKAYGKNTVFPLSRMGRIKRIPTGSADLDINLGGGLPAGRINMIWGPKSTGKTTLCGHVVKQAGMLNRHDLLPMGDPSIPGNSPMPLEPIYTRDKDGEVVDESEAIKMQDMVTEGMEPVQIPVLKEGYSKSLYQEPMRTLYVNQEGTLDIDWMMKIGVNPDFMLVVDSETGERTVDIVDAAMRDRVVDLVIVDSVAAMTPFAEWDGSAEDSHVGRQARLMNHAMRTWVSTLQTYKGDDVRPTIVLVNQVRHKIGVMFGSPETMPGGKGMEFTVSCEIRTSAESPKGGDARSRGGKGSDYAHPNDGGHLLFNRLNYRITKNKTYPPKGMGQYLVTSTAHDGYGPAQIIQEKQVLNMARDYGLMTQAKKNGPWTLGDHKFKTLKASVEWAQNSPEEFRLFQRHLVSQVVAIRNGSVPVAEAA
jgi:RecA/RadA recombinase